MIHYYCFAAKGIQDYILRGDRLRLMVGGSELIESLPNKFLARLLDGLGLKEPSDYEILSRVAGGARIIFKEGKDAERLAEVLPLAVSLYAPGLEVVQDLRPLNRGLADVMADAEKALSRRRSVLFAASPSAGPLVERAPRTGLPVAEELRHRGRREPADAAMLARDGAADAEALRRKIYPDKAMRFAENIEEIAGERGCVAVLHADGNGLGRALSSLLKELAGPDQTTERYRSFCAAVDASALAATRAALDCADTGTALLARPLVCAGDDVTMILRGKDALAAAKTFLETFESESLGRLGRGLTAAAGIAFVPAAFPFAQAYRLCESLCAFAKEKSGRRESSLAFWRVTSSAAESFGDILKSELTAPDGNILTMMPYGTGGDLPSVADLLKLKDAVAAMPRGGLRGLLSDIFVGREVAQRAFERVVDVAKGRGKDQDKQRVEALQGALSALTQGGLWKGQSTPLHDAVELLAAEAS